MTHEILLGDVLDVLAAMPDASADALFCDPPYGLRFMSRKWDYSVPSVAVWAEALRVLKPGAPLLAFGGSRTFHRLAVNIEDAGFELRDCLMWLYGSAMPKSQNISIAIDKASGDARPVVGESPFASRRVNPVIGALGLGFGKPGGKVTSAGSAASAEWDGYGTGLKPAHEPIVLARRPLDGTMAHNVAAHGVGGLAIDASRIEAVGRPLIEKTGEKWAASNMESAGSRSAGTTDVGRWPANVLLDEDAARALDAQTGESSSTPYRANEAIGDVLPFTHRSAGGYADTGGASRFFYTAKADRAQRNAGCSALPHKSGGEVPGREAGKPGTVNGRAGAGGRSGNRNVHPTVKPLSLARYLARLVLPPRNGRILVPFSGSGSEMIGCLLAGWDHVTGIEREEEYATIARARLERWQDAPIGLDLEGLDLGDPDPRQLGLLGGVK